MKDPDFGYQAIFLMGIDAFMLLFNLQCFQFFDMFYSNTMLSFLHAYWIDQVFCMLRAVVGEFYLSQKSLID